MSIDYHRRMLADGIRNDAFARALKQVIVPGKTTVADIGAGTGILGFLAAKLGAKKVYLYEQGPVIEVARKLASENRLRNCMFVHHHSTRVRRPPHVDLVICETLGNFAYEENILESLDDAKRFLKASGGTIMPSGITQYAAPLIDDRLWRELIAWRKIGFGLAFDAAEDATLNNVYVRTVQEKDLLGEPQEWDRVLFPGKNGSIRKGDLSWEIDRDAAVYGFALWWEATLVPGIALSTSPLDPPTHWEQIILPLRAPLRVRARDRVRLGIASDSRWQTGINVQWQATHLRSGRMLTRQAYDMQKGML